VFIRKILNRLEIKFFIQTTRRQSVEKNSMAAYIQIVQIFFVMTFELNAQSLIQIFHPIAPGIFFPFYCVFNLNYSKFTR
jgi:hypothetical protein